MKAMILAAGRGERLRPLTDRTPKPLLRAGGKPLIGHLLQALADSGFHEIVVNLGHLGSQLREALGDGRTYGVTIQYSQEPEGALETGGAVRQALPLLGEEPFLVVNGDIATDFPFARLRDHPEGLVHLVLIPNPAHKPQGDFSLNGDRLCPCDGPGHTFAGIGVYRRELFSGLSPGRFPLAPLLRDASALRQASGQLYTGFWLDVGTPERLEAADAHYRRG